MRTHLFLFFSGVALAAPAAAQPPRDALRLAVVRATAEEARPQAERVDAALLAELRGAVGISSPTVSPIEYGEAQLTVGCADESRACLQQIATALEVDALLVRQLQPGPGGTEVALMYFDATATDEPTRVQAVSEDAAREVAPLVRRLFGLPEPITPAAENGAADGGDATQPGSPLRPASAGSARASVVTWLVVAAGATALVAGLAFGALAESDFADYRQVVVSTRADADRAADLFESAEERGTVANVCFAAGGALLATGALLLLLDLGDEPEGARVGVAPYGAAVVGVW